MSPSPQQGSCHCGAVKYEAVLDLSSPAIVCNCSMCGRSGTMLSFTPADHFTLKQGEEHLTSYKWGKKHIDHLFCKTCGIKPFATATDKEGRPMVAINVRCLEGVDFEKVPTRAFNGKDK